MKDSILYTVGHSNQSLDDLIAILQKYDVNCIVDVRSIPVSQYAPQFNAEVLRNVLSTYGLSYLHFGKEFGARRTDCLDMNGQVNFETAVQTDNFRCGADRLMNGLSKGFHISLMCSEANPLECHRFSLVSRYFYDHGLNVRHIMKDGECLLHEELERQMIKEYLHSRRYHLPEIDQLFGNYTAEQQRKDAYRLKNKEIGWKAELKYEEAI